MEYTISKNIKGNFEEVKERVIEALKDEKFGIVTQLDMQGTFKDKINKNINKYEVLGACNPMHAYNAIKKDVNMGAFLPCNVILSEINEDEIYVSIVNPTSMMSVVEDSEVKEMSDEISATMKRVIDVL